MRKENPDYVYGNGKIFVEGKGPSISKIGDYFSPFLLSLDFSRSDSCNCISEKRALENRIRHEFSFFTDLSSKRSKLKYPDVRMTDILLSERPVFIRKVECSSPFKAKIVLPPYASAVFSEKYKMKRRSADTLIIEYKNPVSFLYENVFTSSDRMMIFCHGNAKIDSDYIEFSEGESQLFIVLGTERECINNSEYALENCTLSFDEILESEDAKKRALLSRVPFEAREYADILLSLQCENGGVSEGASKEYVSSFSAPDCVKAFLSMNLFEKAKKVCEFFIESFSKDKRIYDLYFASSNLGSDSEASSCGYIANAVLYYLIETGDLSLIPDSLPMLIYCMKKQISSLKKGCIAFSQREDIFEKGLLSSEHIFDLSYSSTVNFIESSEKFIGLYGLLKRPLPKGLSKLGDACERSKEALRRYFVNDGTTYLNYYDRDTRFKRFAYTFCAYCKEEYGFMNYTVCEIGNENKYFCNRCLKKKISPADPLKRIVKEETDIRDPESKGSQPFTLLDDLTGFILSQNE